MTRSIAIVGAGTMGGGIAITSLKAGIPTSIIDTTDAALERVQERVKLHFAREVDKGRMSQAQCDQALHCLTVSTDLDVVRDVDLLIEAVFEDLAVKHALLIRLQPLLKANAVIATNTSCLQVTDIGKVLKDPGRLLGLHYFSPAELSPTVEVISTSALRPEVRNQALAFLAVTGKSPLPCKDSPGFALNRFFCPYCNEAVRLFDEGVARKGQIDLVARETFGVPAGPFKVMNLTKPVIMLRAMQGLQQLGEAYSPAVGLVRTGEAGLDWEIEEDFGDVADPVRKIIASRLRNALCIPAFEALEQEVVKAEDLHRGAREALRFERTPVTLLKELSPEERHAFPQTSSRLEALMTNRFQLR